MGDFFYSTTLHGWAFTGDPKRRMSALARYYAAERGVENHDGEPFVWVSCPFCGLDLPAPSIDVIWRTLTSDEGDQ